MPKEVLEYALKQYVLFNPAPDGRGIIHDLDSNKSFKIVDPHIAQVIKGESNDPKVWEELAQRGLAKRVES